MDRFNDLLALLLKEDWINNGIKLHSYLIFSKVKQIKLHKKPGRGNEHAF